MAGSYANAGKLTLYYVERGAGRPVLWIHGNWGSSRWFDKVMDMPGFRHVALDLPNFGRSQALDGDCDIDRYADAVYDFMIALKLEKPILVGHSLGGTVAMTVAVKHPEAVAALVLVDSAAPSGLVTPPAHYPVLEMIGTNRPLLEQALRGVAPTIKDEAFFQSLVDDALLMAAPARSGNAVALERFNLTGATAAFTKPVLVVWGRKDAIVTEAMVKETVAAFPSATSEILENVGHSVLAEDPERFEKLFAAFVATLK